MSLNESGHHSQPLPGLLQGVACPPQTSRLTLVPASFNATQAFIGRLRKSLHRLRAAQRLAPQPAAPSRPLRASRTPDRAGVGRMWDHLLAATAATEADRAQLADPATLDTLDAYARSIEGMIGTIKLPVGLAGPLRVNGLHASGTYGCAFLVTFGLFLQLRAADEVKDLEDDRRHRPERPIPRGLVSPRLIVGPALGAVPLAVRAWR